jgi:two-component system CheB/CheR fusion protein
VSGDLLPGATPEIEPRVLAERVRMLYARAPIAQATVVVNAAIVAWIFRGLVPPALSLGWMAALWALAALRMALVRAYRRGPAGPAEAVRWARRFAAQSALVGIGWGSAALVFSTARSPLHELFLAFVLGGMAAGAASSNASYPLAFIAFAAPALLPMVVRLAATREPVQVGMAFMMTLFGVAVAGISRTGSRAIQDAIRLRFRNEALVEGLTEARGRLEEVNADLERRVGERTGELERLLASSSEAREALREADRRKDQFLAVLSHELRNPLAPIRNSIWLLDRFPPGSRQATLAREVIGRQTGHLARIVDDLLDVTRISKGKIELRRAHLELGELVRRACDDHRTLFQDHGIELRVEAPGPAWVDADATRITQVIGNLLQNAAKFGRRGGTVVVELAEAGGDALIRVRDDGAGISPDLLPRLFEPFVQAEDDLARSRGGLGLGLALAKSLAELHGGSIGARSDGPGRGSEFVVRLPLVPAPRASTRAPIRAEPTGALEILVIEDNEDEARSLAALLESEGHRVHVASSGQSGIAKAHELEPAVILCDIGLPDVDGYEVARTLRAGEHSSARLIALTGYALPEDRRRAREAGFDAHVAKPPAVDALLELVKTGAER